MSKFKAVTVLPHGATETVEFEPSSEFSTYTHIQNYVGGLAAPIKLARDLTVWVNADADQLGLTRNNPATVIASFVRGKRGRFLIEIKGPAIFTGGADDTGEALPLDDAAAVLVERCVAEMEAAFR